MEKNLEKKTKSIDLLSYQINDFVAIKGLGNYSKRNDYAIDSTDESENGEYIIHMIGLVAYNAAGYVISTLIATQLSDLIKNYLK